MCKLGLRRRGLLQLHGADPLISDGKLKLNFIRSLQQKANAGKCVIARCFRFGVPLHFNSDLHELQRRLFTPMLPTVLSPRAAMGSWTSGCPIIRMLEFRARNALHLKHRAHKGTGRLSVVNRGRRTSTKVGSNTMLKLLHLHRHP